MARRLFLYDDEVARSWHPFSLTRPVGELLFGALLLRERIERWTRLSVHGYLGLEQLVGFDEPDAPWVLPGWSSLGKRTEGDRLILVSRYVPPLSSERGGVELVPEQAPVGGARLMVEDRTAGWLLPETAEPPDAEALAHPDEAPGGPDDVLELPGVLLPDPWTLMTRNPEQIALDLAALFPDGRGEGASRLEPAPGIHVLGSHPVSVAPGVQVDPGVVLDATEGPIHLARDVRVRATTRLDGPLVAGPGSVLLGGVLGALSCGPLCKLHGEVEASVVLGYTNKAHDGYLGHSVLGRWVNLGAFTTNSDLKNTYGTVRVPDPRGEGEVETGLLKVGVFLGDHVRTGIGTLLNTGSVVGAGSNLFGGAMPPRRVPPFSWGVGDELVPYRKDAFLATARRVMARRDVTLTPEMEATLAQAWDRSHGGGGTAS